MIYVPLFHPKVTGLFPAKSAALFNRYLLQFSIVIYNITVILDYERFQLAFRHLHATKI
jgi:hypothetical protein